MKTHPKLATSLLFALSFAACGKGPAEIKGNLGGKELSPRAATFDTGTSDGTSTLGIAVSDNDAMCDDIKANKAKANSRTLGFVITGTSAVQAGKYDVAPTLGATPGATAVVIGGYKQLSDTCAPSANEVATSGTLTLSKVDKDTVEGTFDVTFDNGDKASGSFTASSCPGSLAASNSSIATNCSK